MWFAVACLLFYRDANMRATTARGIFEHASPAEMKLGYRRLCYRASDYPGFIWNSYFGGGFWPLGVSWTILERSWGGLGAVLEHLGMYRRGLGPSWRGFGAVLGRSGSILGCQGAVVGRLGAAW